MLSLGRNNGFSLASKMKCASSTERDGFLVAIIFCPPSQTTVAEQPVMDEMTKQMTVTGAAKEEADPFLQDGPGCHFHPWLCLKFEKGRKVRFAECQTED
ncbi:hypothetical protein NPIL_182631 [Nephila pilipes]|uniref:Uncharacterized protein n=1 Tax=Nephila pilipes TaxID=299642 RepID=A0A8X6QUN6_NEPPI|nr:hypothetical protein NPIL_182631 [Nephila pilipes]